MPAGISPGAVRVRTFFGLVNNLLKTQISVIFYKKSPRRVFFIKFMYRQPRKPFSPQDESLDVWQRLTRLLMLVVLVGVAVLVVSFFAPQLERQREMEAENTELASLRSDLQHQLDQRLNQQRLLRTDPEYLEQFARDRLDLQKEGETIIRIDRSSGVPRVTQID